MKVGRFRPHSPMQRGTYRGTLITLAGETAIISEHLGDWVIQADNQLTGYGLGWWWFPKEDWEIL